MADFHFYEPSVGHGLLHDLAPDPFGAINQTRGFVEKAGRLRDRIKALKEQELKIL